MSTTPADPAAAPPEERGVTIASGNLHLPREVCERYFAGATSVALLVRDGQLSIVPLAGQTSGGLLLKIRNARGDRVIHAQEFFRERGFAESAREQRIEAIWSSQWAALVLPGVRRADAA